MRILFAGDFADFAPDGRTDEERWARALERRGARVIRLERPWAGLEARIEHERPELVLLAKCQGLGARRVEALAQRPDRPVLAQVLFDLMDLVERDDGWRRWRRRNRLEWWLPMARHFDVVFHREKGNLERYAALGVRGVYLDQAADAEEVPAEDVGRADRCDVAFFGRFMPARAASLQALARTYSVRVHTTEPRKWRGYDFEVRPPSYGRALARAIRGAGLVYGESATHAVEGYWSDRVYRVLGHRGFFVTRYTPGLETFFDNGEHLVWFRRDEELPGLVHRWLADEAGRERIAAAGYEHVRAHHTYDHRAAELLRQVAALPRR